MTIKQLDKLTNWLNDNCLGQYLEPKKCSSKICAYYVKEGTFKNQQYAHYICNTHLKIIKKELGYKVKKLTTKELFYLQIK